MKKQMKDMLFLYGLAATQYANSFNELSESSKEFLKEIQEANKKHQNEKIMLNRGLKKFVFDGVEIWAVNKRNPIRKHNKKSNQ